ncbi:MAG: hypothetical protein HY914_07315 [Desulfomonile tiedjei]|nr:hypothetical protein [Desulfomonile tiedjei]
MVRYASGVQPEAVDAYVDFALPYNDGPVAELLKSVKRNFGTEGESKRSERRLASSDEAGHRSDGGTPTQEKPEETELTPWHAVAKGIHDTLQDWKRWLALIARLPPKGTPERRKIEAARRRGRDLKKAQELADIKAGGKGSGVWTEKELAGIRQTREFPPDAVWHHDPTVANRPDLAADPRVVRPLRGGTQGHLWDGHGGNFQNPK